MNITSCNGKGLIEDFRLILLWILDLFFYGFYPVICQNVSVAIRELKRRFAGSPTGLNLLVESWPESITSSHHSLLYRCPHPNTLYIHNHRTIKKIKKIIIIIILLKKFWRIVKIFLYICKNSVTTNNHTKNFLCLNSIFQDAWEQWC